MSDDKNKTVIAQFNCIYESTKEKILNFCMARSRCNLEVSEDCTQEAFIVLFKRMKNGETFENPKAFLYKTANNFLMKAMEKNETKSKNETSLQDESFSDIADKNIQVDSKINYEDLTGRINEILSEEEKRLFKLRFVEDLKITDISQALGYNEATCATKIHRMRSKIKRCLDDYYIEKGAEKNDGN